MKREARVTARSKVKVRPKLLAMPAFPLACLLACLLASTHAFDEARLARKLARASSPSVLRSQSPADSGSGRHHVSSFISRNS